VSTRAQCDPPQLGAAARALWPLDPAITYLNHGGFGVTPREVMEAAAAWRARIEGNPSRFMSRELPALVREAAAALADYLGVHGEELGFVDNATTGCNAVLRSLRFGPGDEILITNLAYGAIANAARYVVDQSDGARLVTADIPLPLTDTRAILDAIAACLTSRTRLALFEHVASSSALVIPVAELSRIAHAAGASVLIDGAHAPGLVPLSLPGTGADWYVGDCHKWLMAPRASAFLWASPHAPAPVHPTSISFGYGRDFVAEFDWTGTRDPASALSVPAGIAFHSKLGGPRLMARNRELAAEAARMLVAAWGTHASGPEDCFAAMVSVRLPGNLAGSSDLALQLRARLSIEHRIEVEIFPLNETLWVRIAAQAYNELDDYRRLAEAIPALLRTIPA
jgi:isopenicillin-N epimerase